MLSAVVANVKNPQFGLWLLAGALACGFSVVFGAFGAHAFKNILTESNLNVYRLAVQYQMWHGFAILISTALYSIYPHNYLIRANRLFVSGLFLFCGSLYTLAFVKIGKFGIITPVGGLLLIAGWAYLVIFAWQMFKNQNKSN